MPKLFAHGKKRVVAGLSTPAARKAVSGIIVKEPHSMVKAINPLLREPGKKPISLLKSMAGLKGPKGQHLAEAIASQLENIIRFDCLKNKKVAKKDLERFVPLARDILMKKKSKQTRTRALNFLRLMNRPQNIPLFERIIKKDPSGYVVRIALLGLRDSCRQIAKYSKGRRKAITDLIKSRIEAEFKRPELTGSGYDTTLIDAGKQAFKAITGKELA